MRRRAILLLLLAGCASASGMDPTATSPNPAPANEPDTEPLPNAPKRKVPDPRVPLDAGHGT